MAQLESLDKPRFMFLERMKKPQLIVFYVSVTLIVLVSFNQFKYLLTQYWFSEDWLSKGPIIWMISLFVIHCDLSRGKFRKTLAILDIALTVAFAAVLILSLFVDPLLAPTLLIVFAWYLASSATNLTRIIIIWLFLFFSLPFYSQLVPGLQILTVLVTENLLGVLGIPVLVQEYYIAIPDGQFFVEEGCSGFNYLASNLMLLFIYSLLSKFNFRQFLLGLLVTVTLALFINWTRVVLIILFGYNFGIDHSFLDGHSNFGWFLYVLSLLLYFYLMRKIDNTHKQSSSLYKPAKMDVLSFPAGFLLALPLIIVFFQQRLFGI